MNAEPNSILTLPGLIQLLSDAAGIDAAEAQKFVHEFFALTEEELAAGNTVKIKGLGTFAVSDLEDGSVNFSPDKDLAAAVNGPFAMFEPVELGDIELPDDDSELLTAAAVEESTRAEDEATAIDETPAEDEIIAIDETPAEEGIILIDDAPDDDDTVAERPAVEESPGGEVTSAVEESLGVEDTPAVEDSPEVEEPPTAEESPEVEDTPACVAVEKPVRKWPWVLAIGGMGIAGFAAGFLLHDVIVGKHPSSEVRPVVEETTLSVDTMAAAAGLPLVQTVEEVAVEPRKPVEIFDTISRNHFLASMARRHFGHMEYWVYIYEANPGLGHPDRIKPGTVVRIPDSSEFEAATDSATMARALKLYAEIYGRY